MATGGSESSEQPDVTHHHHHQTCCERECTPAHHLRMSLTTGHVVSSTRGLLIRALRSRALRSRARPPTTAVAASLTTAAPQRAAVVASGSLPGSLTGSGCSFRASPSYPSSLASIASTARRRSTIIPQAATADARVAEETDVEMLGHAADRYGGVIVDPETLPDTVDAFADRLEASIAQWIAAGVRGVWLKIPKERAEFVGVAVHSGKFGFHHAEPGYVMMTRWLPNDEPDMLPPNASHQVGVGAFVTDGAGKVLLVQERRGPAAAASRPDFWKLPTGLVEQGEDIPSAAVREVEEETGVRTEFHSILGIRHGHNVAFGKSDMFFLVSLKLKDGNDAGAIKMCEQELADAQWRSIEDMAQHNAHIMPGSHMDHMYGLCVEHAAGRYAGMGWQALPIGFNRDGTVVTYSNEPTPTIMGKKTSS